MRGLAVRQQCALYRQLRFPGPRLGAEEGPGAVPCGPAAALGSCEAPAHPLTLPELRASRGSPQLALKRH